MSPWNLTGLVFGKQGARTAPRQRGERRTLLLSGFRILKKRRFDCSFSGSLSAQPSSKCRDEHPWIWLHDSETSVKKISWKIFTLVVYYGA